MYNACMHMYLCTYKYTRLMVCYTLVNIKNRLQNLKYSKFESLFKTKANRKT